MNNTDFLAFVGPAAYEIECARGYPMEALLTQVHLETGGLSAYPADSFNVLGIKYNGQGEYVEAETTEWIHGKPETVTAKFQKFDSLVDCLNKWADLMDKPWYAQAQPYKRDWAAFLALIWHDGNSTIYATDGMYLWKAVKRASEVGVPAWCADYRRQMQEPVVTVYVNGSKQPDAYRIVNSSVTGKLRGLLNELQRCGYSFSYDWRQKSLWVKRP